MRLAVGLLVVLVLLAGFPLQSAPLAAASHVPRGPIVIQSDANFTAENGVVAGTGTPADPYVISGWNVVGGSGTAIRVTNVTRDFVIADNLVSGTTGILVHDAVAVGTLSDNQIHASSIGVRVERADALVLRNSVHFTQGAWNVRGVVLYESDSRVEANLITVFSIGIDAERGSPVIVANDIHGPSTGIEVTHATYAQVDANIVTNPRDAGIYLNFDIASNVTGNFVTTSDGRGIEIWANKDVHVANNSVRYSGGVGVAFESSSGNLTGNLVLDGRADAVIVWHSPLLVANNTVTNNLGIGLHFQASAATAQGNVLVGNGVGIALHSADVVHLEANVLMNNTVGISIPYEARQAIVHMEANFVNGVNVDGTVDAQQQVFFYKAANVTIEGQTRDSGFSAGYYGSLTAQGGIVLYEVDTANINATLIAHHTVGVGIVNSFDVNVRESLVLSNRIGVRAEVRTVPFAVPECVVTIKDTNVSVPVDPIGTFGIRASGCSTFVQNSSVSLVDTGIKLDVVTGAVVNTTVAHTTDVAMDLAIGGRANVSGNHVHHNEAGIRVRGMHATMMDNVVEDNWRYGIRLENGANVLLAGNDVSRNGEGLIDSRPCLGANTCSAIDSESNTFRANKGDGLRVNGTSTLRGDTFLANGGTGARLNSATLVGIDARANGGHGLTLTGTFDLRDSTFADNGAHGALLTGAGGIRNSDFVRNEGAGIHAATQYVLGLGLNVSENFDGIRFDEVAAVGTAGTPGASFAGLLGALSGATPANRGLDVHLSVFERNARDAIRAPGTLVNATHNYFGPGGPVINVADAVGVYENGVSPTVRFVPYYTTRDMDQTALAPGIAGPVQPPAVGGPQQLTVYYDDFGWCQPGPCAVTLGDASATTGSALGGVAYASDGAHPWSVVAEGVDGNGMAARAGSVGAGESSALRVHLTVPTSEPAGFFYDFRYKLVGKAEGATLGDVFRFQVEQFVRDPDSGALVSADSAQCLRRTGTNDWAGYDSKRALDGAPLLCARLSPGDYVLTFRFERDGAPPAPGAGLWLDSLGIDRRPALA